MSIRIVTDSTCDLPDSLRAQYGIGVVPLYINVGTESLLDGVELSREDFYARLPDLDPAPTTSVPSPSMFTDAYDRMADEGASAVVSIHISEKLSGTVNIARIAAEATTSVPVRVIDSQTLSMGLGFLALAAARWAQAGEGIDELVDLVKERAKRTHVFAALDTLEFLRRSGRMNRFMTALGSWLKLKPVLKMSEGAPSADRVRTTRRAVERLVDLLRERAPLEEAAIVHTHVARRADQLAREAADLLPGSNVPSVDITPVFGVHLGPGAVGFACVSAVGY